MHEAHPHLARTPWPAEDGGPSRLQTPHGLTGPGAASGTLAAVRQVAVSVMVLLAPGGRVLLLRNALGPDAVSWIEELDPHTLAEQRRSPDLALGPFWPGGAAVLADGSIVVVQGRWAHRLGSGLELEVSKELPRDSPHNSFVVLADGSLVTKDLQRPGQPASIVSVLDPLTLEDRCEPVTMPEPSVARLSARGDEVVVVGVSALHRLGWDSGSATLAPADDPRPYLLHEEQSFGWDPVLTAGATWWLDNGDHTFERTMSMLGNGVAAGPVRLWRAEHPTGELASVEVCGLPGGAVTNPPYVDERRGLVLGYDSANGVLAAFGLSDLEVRWRRPLRTAQHLIGYPDTGEVLANDFDPDQGDALVVLDVESGDVRVRVPVDSPAQSVVFGAPGLGRDAYYLSLTTIARVAFDT